MKKINIAKTVYRLLLLIVLIVCVWMFKPFQRDEAKVESTHTMLIQQIEELGKLEVAKYSISDVIEYTKRRTWLPNSRAAILVMGEVIACVDLTKVQAEHVLVDGDSVHITLPLPEICSFKIDHSRSKIYDVKYGLWETHELVDEAYKEAEVKIHEQALAMGITDESKINARKVLRPFLHMMGFKRIGISFEKAPFSEN